MTDVANLVLGVDSRPVKEGTSALDDLTEAGSKAEKATSLLGKAFGAAISTAVLTGWHHAVTSAMEAEQASAKLGAALNATGYAAGLTKSKLDDMADSMALSTKFDDESIRNASAVLLTFRNVQGETFEQGIKLAADLSSMLGSDLTSASLQVGKALNDPVHGITALSRAGVQFSEVQKDQIKNFVETNQLAKAQEIILGELQGQLGGTAEAMNTGLSKALNDNKKAWDELFEAIGKSQVVQVPTLGFFSALTSILTTMKEQLAGTRDQFAGMSDVMALRGPNHGGMTDEEALAELGAMGGALAQKEKQDAEAKYLAQKAVAEKKKKLDEQALKDLEKLRKEDQKGVVDGAAYMIKEDEETAKEMNKIAEEESHRVKKLQEEDAKSYIKGLEEMIKEDEEAWKGMTAARLASIEAEKKAQKEMWVAVEKTAHDSFVNIWKGGTDVFQKLTDTLENTLVEMLYQMTIKPYILKFETQVNGAGGFDNFLSGLIGAGAGGGSPAGWDYGPPVPTISMDGGGYTGSGSRSGGLDGKGGFTAILHPNETVVDHSKGQSAGGITVHNSPIINIDSRTDRGDVLRIIQQAVQNGNAQLVDSLTRARRI